MGNRLIPPWGWYSQHQCVKLPPQEVRISNYIATLVLDEVFCTYMWQPLEPPHGAILKHASEHPILTGYNVL